MKNNKLIYSSLFALLFFANCGRKQKNIFYFPEKKTLEKINKLELPTIKILSVKNSNNYNEIIWQKIKLNSDYLKEKNIKFAGYNVYKLVNSSIVPKKSLNKNFIKEEIFIDKKINKNNQEDSYIIRPIFKKEDQFIQGPASQIFSIKYY